MNKNIENEYGVPSDEQKRDDEYNIPEVEPGLGDISEEPEIQKDKKPPLSPEKIQEIIDDIGEAENEEEKHEKEVDEIIKKIHPDKN